MSNRSRILILLASLALGLMYVLPVWRITLEAPQYPEGLGMVIRIDDIAGVKEHDLRNINNLNHYIGMRVIEPDDIPELRIMPWVVAALMLGGALTAALGRRHMLYLWTAAFVTISVVGMADFYRWEYDYGHNLDEENAIIKIPGMSYQPPLIGSRQILNFTAHSWPGGGGWAAILACGMGVFVTGAEMRRARRGAEAQGVAVDAAGVGRDPSAGPSSTRGGSAGGGVAGAALLAMLLSGCADPEPRALVAGVDTCAHCLMTLAEAEYGSELVTTTGVVHTFDSVECLVSFLEHGRMIGEVHSLWVTDFGNPRDLVPAEKAFYLVSPSLGSPMGLGVTAFAHEDARNAALQAFGGEASTWRGVKELVTDTWPNGRPVNHGGHGSEIR